MNINTASLAELQSLLTSHSNFTPLTKAKIQAKIAGLQAEQKAKPAAAAATTPPAAAPAIDLDAIRKQLSGSQEQFVQGQYADIDRQAERGTAQGVSNMISSGLAGTTAVGGMQVGVTEAATRAKTNVAAGAQQRTDQLLAQYTGLAQSASEGALNRSFQAGESALNRTQQMNLAGMSQPRTASATSTPGLDAFGSPMTGSVQALEQQYPFLSSNAPRLF